MHTTSHLPATERLAYTADDLAKLLNCSKRHIAALNASGRLPKSLAFGRCRRWLAEDFRDWLKAGAPSRDKWEVLRQGGAK